jgi:hypothetical protein
MLIIGMHSRKGNTGAMMWSVEDRRIVCPGEGFGFLRYDRRQFLSVQEPDRQPGAAGSRVEHDRGRVSLPLDHGPVQRPSGS